MSVRSSIGIALCLSVAFSCAGGASDTGGGDQSGGDAAGSGPAGRAAGSAGSAGASGASGSAGSAGASPSAGSPGAAGSGGNAAGNAGGNAAGGNSSVAGSTGNGAAGAAGSSPTSGGGTLLAGTPTIRVLPTAAGCLNQPTDVAFDPNAPGRAWLPNLGDNSMCIVMDTRATPPQSERRVESSAEHYFVRPMGIAMGGNTATFSPAGTFALALDSAGDGNPSDGGMWNGVTLWSSNLTVFGKLKGGNGNSHLDMLHDSPLARGIAWEKDNIYWVFGSMLQDLTRYDFAKDHGPGNADHSDGNQWHYAAGLVKGRDGVPSHLVYDPTSKLLYIADTGNRRIARMDTASGTMNPKRHTRPKDRVETKIDAVIDGVKMDDVVPAARGLMAPSGIELFENTLFVSDFDTGLVYAFDLAGKELAKFDTKRGAGALMGLAVGPDRKLYVVDGKASALLVIETTP